MFSIDEWKQWGLSFRLMNGKSEVYFNLEDLFFF